MGSRKESVDQIRRFNRRYVPAMRLLDRSYLDTGLASLEAAALLEIGENGGCSARDISRRLNMDKGYLSRAIRRFEEEGLVEKSPSPDDGRLQALALTDAGRARIAELAESGAGIVEDAFVGATDEELARVAGTMRTILEILER